MRIRTFGWIALLGVVGCGLVWGCPSRVPVAPGPALPERPHQGRTAIGIEYALVDNPRLIASMADAFGETGLTAIKPYAEAIEWGAMQKRPRAAIDFRKLDAFVEHYQRNGFRGLLVALKPHCGWAATKSALLKVEDPTPRPEHREAFAAWIGAVVERYDGDGVSDMPGLRWPVRMFEIGNEFSSYEPEPVASYLNTLGIAYRAAHAASAQVQIAHAAFLTTPVNLDIADPSDYDAVWERTRRVDEHHGLSDLRAVLDRPDLFDLINLHNLGDPYEIEDQMRWLRYETGRRGYRRPVIVSDTVPTSYIGWGSATDPDTKRRGVIVRPAREEDRERLATFFQRLVRDDPETLAWTRGFVAADHVQRAVIACEQGLMLINLAFVTDLHWLTWRVLEGGAGISAWGGAIDVKPNGTIVARYPAYYAITQLMGHLEGYEAVTRLPHPDPRARLYEVTRAGRGPLWIAWCDPKRAILPGDEVPSVRVRVPIGAPRARVEWTITREGVSTPRFEPRTCSDRGLDLKLTHTPVFVEPLGPEGVR